MAQKNKTQPTTPHRVVQSQSLTPELISQLLENQAKEIEIKAQELDLQKQQDENNFEFGKKALDAQLSDRKMQRDCNNNLQKNQYLLISFLSLIIVAVIIISLYFNKDAIAIEIIKAVVFILAGGLGGYGLKSKEYSQNNDTNKINEIQ